MTANPPDLELAAAEHAMGALQSDEMVQLARDALSAGIVHPAVAVLGTLRSPTMAETEPLFLEWLREERVVLPERDAAIWTIVSHLIRLMAARAVAPRDGMRRILKSVSFELDSRTEEYVGDSCGIHHLVGAYYAHDDLRERPTEVSLDGKFGEEAVAALDEHIVELAKEWCARHAGQPRNRSDAGRDDSPREGK